MLEQEGGIPPLLWCPAIASCCKQHLRFADRRANGSSLHPPLAVVVAVAQNVGRAQKHPTHEAALFFGPSGPAGITQP